MLDRKSIYSLNKADSNAIVYIDAEGKTIRLTRQDFETSEEFEKWKAWSDENFHEEEKSDHVYYNHNHYAKLFAESMPVVQEQIKVINHRIEDLEHLTQRQ